MKCPKCNATSTGQSARLRPQSMVDVELAQQRRIRQCFSCGHRWDTYEVDRAELVRLMGLAHRAVMHEL
jgi:transcriptional regulator NrdR family protein